MVPIPQNVLLSAPEAHILLMVQGPLLWNLRASSGKVDFQVPIPETYEYVTLNGKRDFADMIKDIEMVRGAVMVTTFMSSWTHSSFPGESITPHKGPYKK